MGEPLEEKAAQEASGRRFLKDFRETLATLVRASSFAGAAATAGGVLAAQATLRRNGPVVRLFDRAEAFPREAASRVASTTLSLPRHLFLVKEIGLPGTDHAEIESMLGFEMAGLFPVATDQLTWGWYPVEITAEGYTRARVIAIETSVLEEHIEQAGLAGETRVSAEVSTVSLANYLLAARGSWPEEPIAAAAVWDRNIDFAVVGPAGLEFDRGTAWEARPPEDGEVAAEVAASLSIFEENLHRKRISRLYLFSPSERSGLADRISAETGLPVEKLEAPSFLESEEPIECSRAIAAGAALGSLLREGLKISLVPPEHLSRQKSTEHTQALLLTGLLVLLLVGLCWGALVTRTHRLMRLVARQEARAAEISPEANQIDAKRQRLAAIKRQLAGRNRVLEIILELYRVTPSDISLTSLELDENGLLTLKGHAQELYRASEYAQILETSRVLGRSAQVVPQASQRTEHDKTFIVFTIIRDLSEKR